MTPDYTGVSAIECCPSPNHGERRGGRNVDMLLLHYTGMESADGALSWLCSSASEVSAHYLVFEDGCVVQMVPEARRAWHAGKSFWAGETDINSCAIGIEIANPGDAGGSPDFTGKQMAAVFDLSKDIFARHQIPASRVLGHSDVAPDRKQDPGEKFDWPGLAAAGVGLWPENCAAREGSGLTFRPGDAGPAVSAVQEKLSAFGYGVEATGRVDPQTETIIHAFHLHFRPDHRNGLFDEHSMAMLDRLLALVQAN